MQLSPTQKQDLKAFILSTPELAAFANADPPEYAQLATALNANASPDYWVWKTVLTKSQATDDVSVDGTTFSWPIYIARSQGERDGWRELWGIGSSVNPSKANVRAAFDDIFSAAPGAPQRTHLSAMSRRKVRVVEKVFVVPGGANPGSIGNPQILVVEGTVIPQEMAGIMAS